MINQCIANPRCGPRRQRGGVLLAILVIFIIGAAAFLLNALNHSSRQTERNKVTADALAKAKDALIAYAVTYGDTHPGYANGYLPSPDPNGLVGANGEGSSEPSPSANVSAIGRLPWRTLDLPPLRDGNGECLWYAVSGTYNNSPMSNSMMDWDNYGLFQIYAAPYVPLTGATPDLYAVAAVFSPGVALSGQNRSSNGSAPICGGNYTSNNYLDHDTFNSITYDNSAPSTTANAISTFYNAGASANFNDQIIYITRSDIFNAIKKRNDFAQFINNMISNVASCLQSKGYPQPVVLDFTHSPATQTNYPGGGNYAIGRVPAGPPPTGTKNCLPAPYQNWQDNLLYAKCNLANCLTVNGTHNCNGMVIFSGEKTASQTRVTNNDKSLIQGIVYYTMNYLDINQTQRDFYYRLSTTFGNYSTTYASTYDSNNPWADVYACVP